MSEDARQYLICNTLNKGYTQEEAELMIETMQESKEDA